VLKFKGTVLVVSHDRYFLDRTVSRTIELSNGKAEFYSGNYSFYVEERERRRLEQQRKYDKEQAERKRLEEAAARLYQWGTGNEKLMHKSFAIRSRIERMDHTERPESEKKLFARFSEQEFRGDEILSVKGLSKSFGDEPLFKDVELFVRGGERIALIGDNGAGKTTLLKLILRQINCDSGLIRLGPSVKVGYLPQQIKFEDENRSVLNTMLYEVNCTPQSARNRLGAFMFSGDDVEKTVSQLSGGEKSRLKLCMLMDEKVNFLILDEPTNHLDIASRDWIEEAVASYDGALLFVSHDRYFINRFASRIWEITGGAVRDYKCGYERYLQIKKTEKEREPEPAVQVREKKGKPKVNRYSAEKQATKLEREINRLEQHKAELEAEIEVYSTDYQKLMELTSGMEKLESELLEKYTEWEALSE